LSSRKERVKYQLDSGGITHLDFHEIKAIFKADDELIATGGRTILAKVLKGRNRGMILLLIEKIRKTKNPDFTPLLKAWQEVDYKITRYICYDESR
jgi:hypothetical protein